MDSGPGRPLVRSQSLRDLVHVLEAALVIVVTWVLLGRFFNQPITQFDGTLLVAPLTQSMLDAGADWTNHLYRFGVLGGSKMHEFAGTMPIMQVCSALGLETTTTVNVYTVFIQLCFAFLGQLCVQALIARWAGEPRPLTLLQRAVTTWLVAFAPLLGWRLGFGHENLLIGLLPLLVTLTLLWTARVHQLTPTALVFSGFALANGISGLGAQTVIYSLVFGAPLIALAVLDAPRGARWNRQHWAGLAVIAGTALVMLPRLLPMLQHALGDDASRGLEEAVTYTYGAPGWRDWLGSVPWTAELATSMRGVEALHEHNYPLGPLIVFAAVLWPRAASRRLCWGALIGIALAVLFAHDVRPISSALTAAAPVLEAFRVPARAVLPVLMFVPIIALAALWSWRMDGQDASARTVVVALGCAALAIPAARQLPAALTEGLAWSATIAIAVTARVRPARFHRTTTGLLVMVAVLGVVAFDARFARHLPVDPVEDGPRAFRDAVLAQAPELAIPLNRIQLVDPPPPYAMSTAFAARLPSLDGVWYPPRRFLRLLEATTGSSVPPTTCVFRLTRSVAFPVLQQLYNVKYLVRFGDGDRGGDLVHLPPTPGPAWFPWEVTVIERGAEMARALGDDPAHLVQAVARTAWLLRSDNIPTLAIPPSCERARVREVTTDAYGQTATISVDDVEATCLLVVSTNYVSTMRATARVGDTTHAAQVVPVDVALTGVVVPKGATAVILAPTIELPWWTRAGQLLGVLLLIGAIVLVRAPRPPGATRRRPAP